jgi:hypothetical protein
VTTEQILIKKANGKLEPFDIEKLAESLKRSKVSKNVADQIANHILQELEEGMTSQDIYKHAFSLLHTLEHRTALRYSLKKAILDLGPSGFPFEQLVAEVFKSQGYTTVTDQIVRGKCAEHEVDVVAWKEDSLVMSEVKYHSQEGLKSDLKIVLYVKARFDDLSTMTYTYGAVPQKLSEGYLITNTKFTITAIKYAACQNLKVIGWNYPLDGNLHDLIDAAQLHPLTCLHTLSDHDKKMLLDKNIILCKTLFEDRKILKDIGLNDTHIDEVYDEIKLIAQ